MKILQVSNSLAPTGGGSAEVPFQLSKTLTNRGHGVTIYTSSRNLDLDLLKTTGANINAFKTWLSIASFDITPGMSKTVRQEIKNFDIVHLHNYRTYQNIVIHNNAKKNKVPYVLQAHGSLTTYFQKGLLKKCFDAAWGKQILKDAAKVFAVTAKEAEQYRSLGVSDDRIEIVPHGIDLTQFDESLPSGEFKKKYDISPDRKIILYLGRLHKMKGLDILVTAFAELSRRRRDAILVIAGPDDGYLSSLKKQVAGMGIAGDVIFTGPLYGRDKIQAYRHADVYVLPSSYEIFGITILEAWACSKSVIVTDRCGLADVVKGRAGLVVEYNEAQLRNALVKMLDDASMKLKFGQQGRMLIEEQYNWPNIASRIERIYENILSDRKKGA